MEKYLSSNIKLKYFKKSVGEILIKSFKKYKNKPFLYFYDKEIGWSCISFKKFFRDIEKVAFFLKREKINEQGKRALTISKNSYQMLLWEMALLSLGIASTSIYPEINEKALREILEKAKPTFGFVEEKEKKEIVKKIQKIPLYDLRDFENFLNVKAEEGFLEREIEKVNPNEEAFIQFTSGSTGNTKGVILTHKNIYSQQKSFSLIWEIPSSSIFLSYLPWYHSYGGLFERFLAIRCGVYWYNAPEIGKDIDRLFYHWESIKPTHFFSVPKVYVEILKKMRENKKFKEIFFHKNLKILFTAGAPLPLKCTNFFKKNGIIVMEGWGLTETSPTVTLTSSYGGRIHSYVGFPIPGCEIKIDGEGEIYVKGPNVMKGYLEGEETKKVLEKGWLKTGDVGKITKRGLKLICRKDGVLKLLNGKKVVAFPIEEKIKFISKDINYVVLIGDGMEGIYALIFINPKADLEIIKKELILKKKNWKPTKVPFYGFALIPKDLSINGGEVTPSFKVITSKIISKYKNWIKALLNKGKYKELEKNIYRFNP